MVWWWILCKKKKILATKVRRINLTNLIYIFCISYNYKIQTKYLYGITGSVVGHGLTTSGFKPRPGYIWRAFYFSFRFVPIGGYSAHLAYSVTACRKVAIEQQYFQLDYSSTSASSSYWGRHLYGSTGWEFGFRHWLRYTWRPFPFTYIKQCHIYHFERISV